MFTGLVEEVGSIASVDARGSAARIGVTAKMGPLVLGESIAVNGVCVTVERIVAGGFEADLSAETLEKTTLGELARGRRVNLERATALGARMGGHVVLGHVDGTGHLVEKKDVGPALRVVFAAPRDLAKYLAVKGSITIDGVSLTVNEVADEKDATKIALMLVPHTLAMTTLLDRAPGDRVNLEVDVLARYVERQLALAAKPEPDRDAVLLEKLRDAGYR